MLQSRIEDIVAATREGARLLNENPREMRNGS
jgi:hypothetical protein